MSFITLYSGECGFVATDQRVFSAQELQTLNEVTEQARLLGERLATQSENEQIALNAASQEGFEQGLQAGKQEAALLVAEQLKILNKEHRLHLQTLQNSCAELAVDIVRKIAGHVGSEAWLLALAQQGAEELADPAQVTLRVNASQVEAVRSKLDEYPHSRIDRVVGDELLEIDACQLQTAQGHVDVDMETQLTSVLALFTDEISANHLNDSGAAGG